MYGINKTPREIMHHLAQNVRTLRKQQGLSQKKLSELSGVAYATLRKFELSGVISLESLFKLCQALGRLDEFEAVLTPNNLSSKNALFDV